MLFFALPLKRFHHSVGYLRVLAVFTALICKNEFVVCIILFCLLMLVRQALALC